MSEVIHRKDRIVFTAIEVMSELGVQALSTKKIAEYEQISESTVFKHYENKNALLMAVLDYYSQYDLDIHESAQKPKNSGLKGIFYLVDAFTTYYENYPAITAIVQGLDEMRYIYPLAPKVDEIIQNRDACLLGLILQAKEKDQLNQDTQADLLVDLINGSIHGLIRRWRTTNYSFNLKERCMQAVGYILECSGDLADSHGAFNKFK